MSDHCDGEATFTVPHWHALLLMPSYNNKQNLLKKTKKTRVISWARKDRNWIFLYLSSCHSEWAELCAKSLSDSLPPGSGRPSVVSLPLYPPEI